MTTSTAVPSGIAPPPSPTFVPASWATWAGVHGGMALATAWGRAAHTVGDPWLRSVQAEFLSPVPVDSALEVDVEVLRAGRTVTAVSAALRSARGRHLVLTAVTGAPVGSGLPHVSTPPPRVLPPERSPVVHLPADAVPFTQHLEVRNAGSTRPLGGGRTAQLLAWVRLLDGPVAPDEHTLVLLDALPPALFAVLTRPLAIPTVSLSAQLTGRRSGAEDDGGWHLVRIDTEHSGDGFAVDLSSVWDRRGSLLGAARQLRYAR